jgi:hypothetical protein
MRALGPGSVSSLLKLVLDVFSFVLWAIIACLLLAAFVALLLPVDLNLWRQIVSDVGLRDSLQARGPMLAAGLVSFTVILGVVQFIVNRLRRVFQTLTAGDPFEPSNVKRLRHIGFALAALEVINYFARLVANWAFSDEIESVRYSPNLTAWFAVLVVFVLAEVFREGARLRGEAELTI